MKEYSTDMDRLEAKCGELMRRRTVRKHTKAERNIRAMERRQKLLELAGNVASVIFFVALLLSMVIFG